MSQTVDEIVAARRDYQAGFVTDIDAETLPPGLDADVVRFISAKKNEPGWMTDWRLAAFEKWSAMAQPRWAHVDFPAIDFNSQDLCIWTLQLEFGVPFF